jgi:hypothetical protein
MQPLAPSINHEPEPHQEVIGPEQAPQREGGWQTAAALQGRRAGGASPQLVGCCSPMELVKGEIQGAERAGAGVVVRLLEPGDGLEPGLQRDGEPSRSNGFDLASFPLPDRRAANHDDVSQPAGVWIAGRCHGRPVAIRFRP